LRKIRHAVLSKDYDLVVVPQVEPTVMAWIASIGTGRKFAVYLHGNHKFEMRHTKARIMFFLMKHVVLSRLTAVFGVSPTQLKSFRSMFPGDCAYRWLPNPVRRFAPVPPGESRDGIVGFVKIGRFSYQKGHDILLRAFAWLRESRPNTRLVLVGYGEDEAKIRQLITDLRLEACVSIVHLPDNPAPALAAADVYVSASRWEGWSLAICEALRFGLPVVATNCEFGPSDILTDDRLGRLVPPFDEAGLAEAMRYYCDNIAEERRHAGYRRDYIEKYDIANVVDVHAKALEEIVAGRGCHDGTVGQRGNGLPPPDSERRLAHD
jgi:glycosyltransferase involved in cell wall biosynthesis